MKGERNIKRAMDRQKKASKRQVKDKRKKLISKRQRENERRETRTQVVVSCVFSNVKYIETNGFNVKKNE